MGINEILKKLGQSEKEVIIYVELLKTGLSPASNLAERVNLPRQTVYSILEQLVANEFVEQSNKRGVKHFFADPSALIPLLGKKKKQLEDSTKELERELPKLLSETAYGRTLPKIQYYEGEKGLKRLFEGILKLYQKNLSHNFRGYGINNFHKFLGDYLYEFVKQRGELGVTTKLFIAEGPNDFGISDEKSTYGREIKKLAMPPQEAGAYIVGNHIYLFSYKDNVGVTVENEAIATLLKTIFDDHWNRS